MEWPAVITAVVSVLVPMFSLFGFLFKKIEEYRKETREEIQEYRKETREETREEIRQVKDKIEEYRKETREETQQIKMEIQEQVRRTDHLYERFVDVLERVYPKGS